jgi:hypothetical protein
MNSSALIKATAIGLALQVAMVFAGHADLFPKAIGFAVGGMSLSLLAGVLYAVFAKQSLGNDSTGGAAAGGLCALLGIAVSVLLKDVPASLLVMGTVSSVITGAIGGATGYLFTRSKA